MNRHPLDPTPLILGLLFVISGLAIVADAAWPELDTTAVVGATVGGIGIAFVVVLVTRQLRENTDAQAP